METGCWGIDDGIGRLVDDGNGLFLRLLSNVNDCVVPAMNSYSSADDDGVGVISSFCFDGEMIGSGFGWVGMDLVLFGYLRVG
jgi:hypothetical protein